MSFDKHITPTAEQLSHCGVQDTAQALRNLELLGAKIGPGGFSEIVPLLLADLSRAADPDMAMNNFERFVGALADLPSFVSLCRRRHDVLRALITIFGASRFLSTFLVTIADESLMMLSDPLVLSHPTDKQQLAERLSAVVDGHPDDHTFFRMLRLFRKKEMLRIGLRDLLGRADLGETVEDLSHLAEVCLQKAYAWADAAITKRYGRPIIKKADGTLVPAGFAVIAMGKLGGRELNFSSDVDLMYVYTADGETEGVLTPGDLRTNRITNHQYFIKLAEKLSAAINEKTEDGFVFRVDMRLRPEGQRGPLAQSLGGYEIYYESWGQTWERSALLKARPVAGDEYVGREFMARIEPFVYRKYLDYSAIAEIRDMKQKINRDVLQKGRTHRDVKLGYGGIREIEFVIQALQLIYSGRDRTLREKNALKALHVLSQKGLISYQEHEVLSRAYTFLRTVEHRIQILDDLQTQTLPGDERELRTLARRIGYFGHGAEAEELLRDYAEHTKKVRGIYDDLFAFTGEEGAVEPSVKDYSALLDPETPEQEAVSLLGKLGFKDPGKAYRDLLLLREGTAFVHQTPRSRKLFNEIFPTLFQEIISSPDPDMALNHLESFLAAQGSWEAFQTLMRIDPSAGKVLIAVFANSGYLSRMLVSRPILLQNLIESRKSSGAGTCARFAKDLGDALERSTDLAEKLDALRRFKHLEEIRIGMADLLSNVPLRAVSRDLSKLAESCLSAALWLAASEVAKRYNAQGATTGLAVIGAGKLGGRELSYGSDLDILFVFTEARAAAPPDGVTVFEYFSKVAEKTISYLSTLTREGFVFRVDTRLRPTGSKGPLVQSVDAFKNYYAHQAETWELQALLRARCVAGDRVVGEIFCHGIQELLYRDVDRASVANDITSMRKKMEDEVGRENDAFYNIKQGEGGIVDIEFLVQYLQLLHGKQHQRVRVPGTYNALRALNRQGLLDTGSYQTLMQAYLFMRQLESRMRIVSNQATNELSRDPAKLIPLAQRMGYLADGATAGQMLLDDYYLMSRNVRNIFDKMLS
ncbi:MAG: bifunctional [glutamate--ammonia ligase]-adenylyl-L-tyrosine phosphorylase/[glutamate--ammonia-ligase] adenylyltransferase [Nitrospirae bacterium]|nr:bifunctional [glutamate--ammonia ligase]-adenylyl-L-tyrosine phosphorylase/[glutamate--ammonia-ligase] adenylyltransferase [Nitrospirota bacterium]